MNTFFDKMRSGAGKAAFEADKLRRIALLQNELRGLRDEFQKALGQTGQVAFSLYQRGQVTQPELRAACDAAAAAMAHINAQEAEVEHIRNEQYVDPLAAAEPLLLCPVGHGPLPAVARFCQQCGQPGVAAAPVAPPAAAFRCPTCGEGLAADARFCANCGQPLAPPAPEPPAPTRHAPAALPSGNAGRPPSSQPETVRLGGDAGGRPAPETAARCPSCGGALDHPNAAFCNLCGYTLQRET